jgi:hypothetical protein
MDPGPQKMPASVRQIQAQQRQVARELCSIGDTIETTLSTGDVITMKLETPESAAYANDLIAAKRWRKI